jgi:hypothetical protein
MLEQDYREHIAFNILLGGDTINQGRVHCSTAGKTTQRSKLDIHLCKFHADIVPFQP